MARSRWGILGILLLSLLLRVAWATTRPSSDAAIDQLPDQREYLSLGRNLLHDHALAFFDARFNQTIYTYRTPGYPAFIAACGGSATVVRIAQACLDTLTVFAVFMIAWRLAGPTSPLPLIAACFVALNPFLIYFCGLILSETLFTAALACATVMLIDRRWILGGILMLVAVLVRPSAIALAPLLTLVAAANRTPDSPYRLGAGLRAAIIPAAIVTGIVFLGLLPWAARNHRVLGAWVWTTTNEGVTLYDGFNPAASGGSDQRFLTRMPELRSMNELRRSRYLHDSATSWAREHLSDLPALMLRKIARTWSPVPLSAEFGRTGYRLISAAYAVPSDVLAIAGLLCSRRLTRLAKGMLVTPVVYFTIVHAMSVGSLRYRVPVEPMLAVLAAAGAMALRDIQTDGTREPSLIAQAGRPGID
jgi:hypothetical protein